MSTIAEIESAIAQLPPEEFCTLQEWMTQRAAARAGRMWTPDELTEGAKRMVAEPDPARANALKKELMRGFYGMADA